jgi:hypothetical protein
VFLTYYRACALSELGDLLSAVDKQSRLIFLIDRQNRQDPMEEYGCEVPSLQEAN